MENIGLNNDVLVGERKFHVQTNFSDTKNMIVSNVFYEGQVIESKEVPAGNDTSDIEFKNRMHEVHQELVTELEVLYYISEKVKTVRHAPSANKLGLLFLQKSLYKEAIDHFNLALEIQPDSPEVYCNLGKTHLIAGDYNDAIAVLENGAAHAPQFADIQNYLGVAYLHTQNLQKAISHMEDALKLNPNYIGVHYHLGMAFLAQSLNQNGLDASAGDLQVKAEEQLNIAAERMVNRNIPNFTKVIEMVRRKSYQEAVKEFFECKPKEVLTQFLNVENEFYLKFMYGGKGKNDSYISDYVGKLQELIDEYPNYADLRNSLGIVNLIQCRNLFLKSLNEFRAALKINPKFKKAEKNLKLAENDGKGFLILLRAILK
ncbi:tetratricopeptide repeat protein [candidate division KSB1 bacterium]|nr:tetratricopeptide repeat protein [candidate division KSB1 bacterium]